MHNTAVAFADGINGIPHPRHNLGPPSSAATATNRSRGTLSPPMLFTVRSKDRLREPPEFLLKHDVTCPNNPQ
ncbi:hypothetical protein [Streptomyces sp. NPDC001100]